MLIHKWDTVCQRQRGWPVHTVIHVPHLLSERQLIICAWVLVCPICRRLGNFLTNVTQSLGYGPRQPLHHGWRVPTQVRGLHIFWELVRRMVAAKAIPTLDSKVRGKACGLWDQLSQSALVKLHQGMTHRRIPCLEHLGGPQAGTPGCWWRGTTLYWVSGMFQKGSNRQRAILLHQCCQKHLAEDE